MSMEATLRAEKRGVYGKGAARKLRAEGHVPAVLYGKGTDPVSLSLDAHGAELLFQSISVENTIVSLEIAGERAPVRTLIREIQVHPFRPVLLHVDFLRIREGELLEVAVPVHLVGQAEGVANGGILQQALHEVQVRCLPDKIPESIEVDVSHLEVGNSLQVSQLTVPADVELLTDGDLAVCSVVTPKVVEEAVEAEAEAEAEAEEEAEAGEEAAEASEAEESETPEA